MDEAISQYQEALQIDPDYAEAHINLGTALLQEGRLDEAIPHFQKALQINPGYAKAHNNLGNAFLQKGNVAEAIAHFQRALQLEPADPWPKNNLAWILATCPEASLRDGKKAVELAWQANALTGGENLTILHTLAAAFAEAGRFSEAVETAQRALHLAEAQSNARLAGKLQYELKLFQAGKPFHNLLEHIKAFRNNMIGQPSSLKVPVGAGRWEQRWRVPAVCLVLAAITFAVFGQTAGFGFVNFDDGFYVYENAKVAGGLSLKGLAWVFTHADCNLYHPLTMLSLMGDYQLHGLHAGGYHFTNVLLHTASVILLFLILRQMTGALWRSAFVAAVFAIHPLRVESVAWVAERKDVLSAFFFMLTLGAYVRYVRKPDSLARYLMVAAAFVLALLSKPTVVTLPFVLLLLDYWPLRRFEQPRKLSRLILEKIPLLALAAGACAMTVLAAGKWIIRRRPCFHAFAHRQCIGFLRRLSAPDDLAGRTGGILSLSAQRLPPLWKMALAGALLAGLSAVAWGGGGSAAVAC